MKNMQGNRYLLDANAILRFLLQDNEEQFQLVLSHLTKSYKGVWKICYDMKKENSYGIVAVF